MRIIPFMDSTELHREQMASLLVNAFAGFASGWKDILSARHEVESFRSEGHLAWVALMDESVVGWVGAVLTSNTLWELHPLAVHPDHQRKGIGKALVGQLEDEARRQGIFTIMLGTDDDFGGTSLFGKDLYPNVIEHLLELKSVNHHPFEFYRSLGYHIVGVIPDASGRGRHDILMAKRVSM